MQERTASEQAGADTGPADQAARPPATSPAQPDSPRTPSTAPRRSRSRLSFFAPRSSPVDPLLAPLLETMTVRTVDWDGWRRIDEHERALGADRGRERLKISDRDLLTELARSSQ